MQPYINTTNATRIKSEIYSATKEAITQLNFTVFEHETLHSANDSGKYLKLFNNEGIICNSIL